MTFYRPDAWVWDFWLADDGDVFHLYYLYASRTLGHASNRHRNARIGHATSVDLRTWVDHGMVLEHGGPDDFDSSATWTGSVVQGPDGLWRMYYVGAQFLEEDTHVNVESIGLATSPDLYTWTKQPGPIALLDSTWYERLGTSSWPEEAWRDPWVFPDPEGHGWHMLITARASIGADDERGVIGHATSTDLDHWTVQAPLTTPGAGFMHLEVPQVVVIEGRTVLLFSCNTAKLASCRRERGEVGGIWAVAVPDLVGPYAVQHATLLATDRYYSGRAVQDRTGRWYLLCVDSDEEHAVFRGHILDPQELRWADDPARPGSRRLQVVGDLPAAD